MSRTFKDLHPINLDFDFEKGIPCCHYPVTYPNWPESLFKVSNWPAPGFDAELEFTGWRDEGIAKHDTVSVSNFLSPAPPVLVIKGPEALNFFNEHLVNSFKKFTIGTAKHAIMCNKDGNMIMQGILYRLGEEEFEAQCLMTLPYVIATDKKKYDMTVEDVTAQRFMMQTSGLRSLELFEELTGENLHDLKYCHFINTQIDGRAVRLYRFGMTGSLGYEVSGNVQDANYIYKRILEVGNSYGIRRMGARSYIMNHTPGGFLQYGCHYQNAIIDDPGFQEALKKENAISGLEVPYTGSYDGPIQGLFANPIEYGAGNVVKFDHDFPGREALEKIAADPKKKMVTLDWNPEDLADIYISQFRDEEPYKPMDLPTDQFSLGGLMMNADKVLAEDGSTIGISTHRTMDAYFKKMLSLCAIDVRYAKEGTEVKILWGNPGMRQKEVRAVVSRFPYNDHIVNRTFDTNTIPYRKSEK